MATLIIKREKALSLKLISFNIYLDGYFLDTISDNQEKVFEIENGNHHIQITKEKYHDDGNINFLMVDSVIEAINKKYKIDENEIVFKIEDETVALLCKGGFTDAKIINFG